MYHSELPRGAETHGQDTIVHILIYQYYILWILSSQIIEILTFKSDPERKASFILLYLIFFYGILNHVKVYFKKAIKKFFLPNGFAI